MAAERPEDFVRRVTNRIAQVRRAKGLTQDQVAEALGTATRNVQRLEAGQNLTLHTLARIANALGVQPEELVIGGAVGRPSRTEPKAAGCKDGPPPAHAVAERKTKTPARKRAR